MRYSRGPTRKHGVEFNGCQLGKLGFDTDMCGEPGVLTVGKVRLCARHSRILEWIERHPDPEADAVRHPLTSPYLRAAP